MLPKLRAFFSQSLIEPDSQHHDGWFAFEGVPLKWHYPVGLLFDLYAGADPASTSSIRIDDSSEGDSLLPWRLTVHFNDWPTEDLVRLDPDGMVMNDAFINSVKEADFLRNGTAKGIMSLSKEDSSGLWKAVEKGEQFCSATHMVRLVQSAHTCGWISGSSIFPANFKHPPTTIITAISKRTYPHILATTAR